MKVQKAKIIATYFIIPAILLSLILNYLGEYRARKILVAIILLPGIIINAGVVWYVLFSNQPHSQFLVYGVPILSSLYMFAVYQLGQTILKMQFRQFLPATNEPPDFKIDFRR